MILYTFLSKHVLVDNANLRPRSFLRRGWWFRGAAAGWVPTKQRRRGVLPQSASGVRVSAGFGRIKIGESVIYMWWVKVFGWWLLVAESV